MSSVGRQTGRVDKDEARSVAEKMLADRLRGHGYEDLRQLVEHPEWFDSTGESGTLYRVKVYGLWDEDEGGVLRVVAGADDGTKGFLGIVSPQQAVELLPPP